MSEAGRDRIEQKIAASREMLERESESLTAVPRRAPLPDAYPPENYRSLAAEYPWLTLAAGAGFGLLVGAMLPRKVGGKLGQRALGAAAVAGEIGLTLAARARDKAADAGREGLSRVGESTADLRERTARTAHSAGSTGIVLAREAIKLAAKLRK